MARGFQNKPGGPAVAFDADRFEEIGAYRNFPMYRDRHAPPGIDAASEIYVTMVEDGPVTPFRRR